MSKFIENHPSAIEVFEFYEGEKEKSNEKSYDKLCNLIGKNRISKEDFEKQYEVSRKKIRELVVNDPSNLRLCILSEVKMKNSVIQTLSQVFRMIGTQDIDYQDFDFWFDRFSSGYLDLDQKTFSDLPIEILGNIVEKLDFPSQMRLRKVSHGLRNIVDQVRPSIDEITYEHHYSQNTLNLSIRSFNGLKLDRYWERSYYREDNFKKALDGMKVLFNNPRLRLTRFNWNNQFSSEIDEKFIEIVNSLNHKIEIVNLKANLIGGSMVDLLKAIKPETLEKMNFGEDFGPIHIDQLTDLDQWKKAKKVHFRNVIPDFSRCIHHFQHFERVDILVKSLSMDDLLFIKKIFIQNDKLERFFIETEDELLESEIVETLDLSELIFNEKYYYSFRRYDLPRTNEYLGVSMMEYGIFFLENRI
uniref:F-box domain-containing protein n=1 Tax=Caenorhabditis tropicalis TaxID=1561998 RepID=A0A1I7UI82_9PELO